MILPLTEENLKGRLYIRNLGLADYGNVLALQQRLREQRGRNEIPNTVLLVEHYPVITLGARQAANRLLAGPEELKRQGIDVVETRRGGGATAHNPGQLVVYPILHLRQLALAASDYVRELEAIGAELLERLRVRSSRKNHLPGLWVEDRKIASVGVRVCGSVTYHGMAINIQNDLSIFELFVPCGLAGVRMTSVLEETAARHSMQAVGQMLVKILIEHFSSEELAEYEDGAQTAGLAETTPAGDRQIQPD